MAASSPSFVRLASRGSPLALAQAHMVRSALAAAHGWRADEAEMLCPILAIRTSGDRVLDRPLAEAGGKGLFVKEIEDALLQDEADIAVHSTKDMPAMQPAGLTLAAVLPREDPADVCIFRESESFVVLKEGALLGTSSVRRQAQVLRARPDLKIVSLRGNVGTRLKKLKAGEADAILLARAGLKRLAITPEKSEAFTGDGFLPALCQGAIGIEMREGDRKMAALLATIDHHPSHLAIVCERAFLAGLDGSCRTPIAGLAVVDKGRLHFKGEVLTPHGRNFWIASSDMPCDGTDGFESEKARAAELGSRAAQDIRMRAGNALPKF